MNQCLSYFPYMLSGLTFLLPLLEQAADTSLRIWSLPTLSGFGASLCTFSPKLSLSRMVP